MALDVLCLRPEADFLRVGVTPPKALSTTYRTPDDPELADLLREVSALLLPAAGPKLPTSIFDGTAIKIVRVTGAGVDRLDEQTMRSLDIPVCNVPGGSNGAVADYAVAMAIMLHRRFKWADSEISAGNYAPSPPPCFRPASRALMASMSASSDLVSSAVQSHRRLPTSIPKSHFSTPRQATQMRLPLSVPNHSRSTNCWPNLTSFRYTYRSWPRPKTLLARRSWRK